jgi:hypothetical protein
MRDTGNVAEIPAFRPKNRQPLPVLSHKAANSNNSRKYLKREASHSALIERQALCA